MERYYSNNGKWRKIAAIYLDFCKTLDKVLHRCLLQNRQIDGFFGVICKLGNIILIRDRTAGHSQWFTVYLENITVGIPQGGVLGPVLSLNFINDITCVINGLI